MTEVRSVRTRSRKGGRGPTEVADLRRGDRVRVRSAAAIAATLDDHADTEQLPFMPEMLPMCGQTFTVQARVSKTCDTINSIGCTRQMEKSVHLVGARCDGSAHGGCQAGCLLFFKDAWLEPVGDEPATPEPTSPELKYKLEENARSGADTYRCQATQLLDATEYIQGYGHYLQDIRTRTTTPWLLLRALPYILINKYQRMSHRFPKPLQIGGGKAFPFVRGTIRGRTPADKLDLQPGELVEVKSRNEILATLDKNQKNRGLWFDREMLHYCGRKARVLRRVDRIIDEKTGHMRHIKSDCIVLEGFVCDGVMDNLCPRAIYSYWREIWLRRIPQSATAPVDVTTEGEV